MEPSQIVLCEMLERCVDAEPERFPGVERHRHFNSTPITFGCRAIDDERKLEVPRFSVLRDLDESAVRYEQVGWTQVLHGQVLAATGESVSEGSPKDVFVRC